MLREKLEQEYDQCCCGDTHCCGTANAAVEGARAALRLALGNSHLLSVVAGRLKSKVVHVLHVDDVAKLLASLDGKVSHG